MSTLLLVLSASALPAWNRRDACYGWWSGQGELLRQNIRLSGLGDSRRSTHRRPVLRGSLKRLQEGPNPVDDDLSLMTKLSESFNKRIQEYYKELEHANQGLDYNPGPWVLGTNVPHTVFDIWVNSLPAGWKVSFQQEDGAVVLFGDPLPPHSRTAGFFAWAISRELDFDAFEKVCLSTDESFIIPGYGIKVPDLCVIQRGLSVPSLVLEIGYKNERNFQIVKDEVSLWSGFGSPIVIGVKISDKKLVATKDNPIIDVLLRVFGQQDQYFHFGAGSDLTCLGLGTHVMCIPSTFLMPDASLQMIYIDLHPLHEGIKEWILS